MSEQLDVTEQPEDSDKPKSTGKAGSHAQNRKQSTITKKRGYEDDLDDDDDDADSDPGYNEAQ